MIAIRTSVVAGLVALAAALPALGATPSPRTMVLQFNDVPSGLAQTGNDRVDAAQVKAEAGWVGAGFVTAWESDFSGDKPVDGLSVIRSIASLYRSAATAHGSLLLTFERLGAPKGWTVRRLEIGAPLGAESRMYAFSGRQKGHAVTFYELLWRSGRVKASVLVGGLTGTLHPVQAVALAKRQQSLRIKP